jgi:hypothetical protein
MKPCSFCPRKESVNGCTCIHIILFLPKKRKCKRLFQAAFLPKKRKSKRLFPAVYYSLQFLLYINSTTMWCQKRQEPTSICFLQVLYLYGPKNINVEPEPCCFWHYIFVVPDRIPSRSSYSSKKHTSILPIIVLLMHGLGDRVAMCTAFCPRHLL